MDPANSPDLLAQLRPHALATDFEVVWCGEGWKPLIQDCHQALVVEFPDYCFQAIEQKLGTLAFQARARAGAWSSAESDAVVRITDLYAEKSAAICEWCGAPGRCRDQREEWMTLCDSCDDQFDTNKYPVISRQGQA